MVKKEQQINDWTKFDSFLKTLLEFTDKVINSLEGKEINHEYQRVLFRFIQRFHLNFTTIKSIWKEYLKNSKFKYPIYLLLRSLISDYLLMLYLIEELKFEEKTLDPEQTEFHNRYAEISSAFFEKMDKEMSKWIRDGIITAEQRNEYLKIEKEDYPNHFEKGEKNKVKKFGNLVPGEIVKRLKKGDFNKCTGIYIFYFYFSQFEHFTIKTEAFLYNDRDEEFKMLKGAVDYLIGGLFLNIITMQLNEGLIEELEKIIDDFRR